MSTTAAPNSPTMSPSPSPSPSTSSAMESRGGSALQTEHGSTSISDAVVEKIAGIAAREVSGVHAMGGSAARAFGVLRDKLPGQSQSISQGVTVEVGERQAAIDLDLVVDYGVSIVDVSQSVRQNVIRRVERMTGLEVTEVNVSVNDLYVEDDSSQEQPQPSRVQ